MKKVKLLSRVWLFATPWTVASQAPPSMGFSRQGYWSGLPLPSSEDLPNPGIEPGSCALQAESLPSEPPRKWRKSLFYCFWMIFYRIYSSRLSGLFVCFFFPFSTLNMLYHFLPFILSSGKSAVIWIFVLMYKSCFFPALFRILFLSLVLSNLIVLLLSVIFLASDAWGTFSFLELSRYIFSSNLKHFRILFLHIFFLF